MNKRIALIIASAIAVATASAQGYYTGSYGYQNPASQARKTDTAPHKQYIKEQSNKTVWGDTHYQNLGYMIGNTLTTADGGDYRTADFGASLQFGNTYMVPKQAFFDMVKLGIDVTWLDLSGASYKEKHTGDFVFDDEDLTKKDVMQMAAGMGIGLSVNVAPLAKSSPALKPLRIQGYARFVPTYSCIMDFDADDKLDMHGAFMPVVSYGAQINYRWFGAGIEFRSGSAKYDLGEVLPPTEPLAEPTPVKTELKSSQTRVYLSLHF